MRLPHALRLGVDLAQQLLAVARRQRGEVGAAATAARGGRGDGAVSLRERVAAARSGRGGGRSRTGIGSGAATGSRRARAGWGRSGRVGFLRNEAMSCARTSATPPAGRSPRRKGP